MLHLRDVVEPPVFRGNEQFAVVCTGVHVGVTGGPWRKVRAALRTVQEQRSPRVESCGVSAPIAPETKTTANSPSIHVSTPHSTSRASKPNNQSVDPVVSFLTTAYIAAILERAQMTRITERDLA